LHYDSVEPKKEVTCQGLQLKEIPIHYHLESLIKDLNPFPTNSRTHSEEQINQVAKSIQEFGFTNPVIIDPDNTIIAGHCRVLAAKKLGMTSVPCVALEGLTEQQRRAYVIADNKLALNAGWDLELLASELKLLQDDGFDVGLTGFTDDEIQALTPQVIGVGLTDDDAVPEVPEEPIAKIGDVWLLGEHRLMCGDSTSVDAVDRLMGGQKPNTMVTDPPYGVNLDMSHRKATKPEWIVNKNIIINDNRSDWFDAYVLFPGSIVYVWHADKYTDIVMKNLRDSSFELKQTIVWKKIHLVLGRSDYQWQHEWCWYAVKKGSISNWKGDRKQTTVWEIMSPYRPNKPEQQRKDDKKTEHPTQKPVELFMKSIMHHTNPGEYVYDPFAGSGTLCIACEKSGRRALMMELDPKYCDVIIKRWEQFTGKKAVLDGGA
jgi:DNA modification methylase